MLVKYESANHENLLYSLITIITTSLDKIINILNNISGYKYHISDLSTYVFKFLCFFSNESSRDTQCHVYHMYLTCIFLVLNDNMDHRELHAVAAVVI